MISRDEFLKDRDEALLSLDKKKIKRYIKKYNIRWYPSNETTFWAAVHKSILQLRSATAEQKARSAEWLVSHGFSTNIQ